MENQNEKRRFIIITVLFAFLIPQIIIWGGLDYLKNGSKPGIGVLVIAFILLVFGWKMVRNQYHSLKLGEPLKDERSRKLETKAAAYAFYIGIYWLLALSMAIEYFNLDIPARSAPNVGLAGLVVIFGLAYWYLSRKGE